MSARELGIALAIIDGFGGPHWLGDLEQAADHREFGAAVRVGEEAEVPDPAEAVCQDVQQEARDELAGRQGHYLEPLRVPGVPSAEADLAAGQINEPIVGDGDPVRVAAETVQHLLWSAERPLGIDDPFEPAQGPQMGGEGRRLGAPGQLSEEAQHPGIEGRPHPFQEQPAIEAREHPDRQEEAGPTGDPAALGRQPAARHYAMDPRAMEEVLPPGM